MLADLMSADNLHKFASILGYKPSSLSFILYRMTSSDKYDKFEILKKGGGTRVINAPTEKLKALQSRLADVLHQCKSEINQNNIRTPLSHGFEAERSTLTNAWVHKNRRYVLNIDVEDFFGTINFGRVRGFFINNRDYALPVKAATLIAQIACCNGVLPQGSPCSPIISNLIGHLLDVRMAGLAKAFKCSYSRYVDDLTVSTNQKQFPSEISFELEGYPGSWVLSDRLLKTISRVGFRLNHSKTRMQCRPSRQVVTGLTVNERVNIRADYYRRARVMCSTFFNHGHYYISAPVEPISGSTTSSAVFAPSTMKSGTVLEGILSHIYHIKHSQALRSAVEITSKEVKANNKIRYPAHRSLYKKFLYFKHFIVLEEPLIMCEGKTDNIYLRSALKALAPTFPQLASIKDESLQSKVRFLKHSRIEHDLLELSGGCGNIANFISRYKGAVYNYKYRPVKHPIIILVDNDSGSTGGGGVFSQAKKVSSLTVDLNTKEDFYYLCHNLYLVKTPEVGATGESCMEDLFDAATLATKVDGKSFNPKNDKDTSTEFGKLVFADRVVRGNFSTIDFSMFVPLLNRVLAAISHYNIHKPSSIST